MRGARELASWPSFRAIETVGISHGVGFDQTDHPASRRIRAQRHPIGQIGGGFKHVGLAFDSLEPHLQLAAILNGDGQEAAGGRHQQRTIMLQQSWIAR